MDALAKVITVLEVIDAVAVALPLTPSLLLLD